MKKVLLIMALCLSAQMTWAKAFDGVFSKFRGVENAEYVKVPGLLARLGTMSVNSKDLKDMPMNIKVSGIRVLEMSECAPEEKVSFQNAVKAAGKNCELMLEAIEGDDQSIIWLEPKNSKKYKTMIIYSAEDAALVELSGTFTPKN